MTMQKVKNFIEANGICKKDLADKMHISQRKLERILNTKDTVLNCVTYRNLCVALGVSADMFFL